MSILIICHSYHHGNTRLVAEHLGREYGCEVVDVSQASSLDLSGYELICLAGGVYFFRFSRVLESFAHTHLRGGQRVVLLSTYGSGIFRALYFRRIVSVLRRLGCPLLGRWGCVGHCSYGPSVLVGGTGKGRPNADDCASASRFFGGVLQSLGV